MHPEVAMVGIGSLVTKNLSLVALVVSFLVWTGCATSRGILEVPLTTGVNPAQGHEVKIVRVTDRRTFQLKPPDPSIPSLKDGAIDNPLITSRAIARKRSGYGMALGDILLPEGQTVEQLTETALTRGLRGAGFRVLLEGQEGYEQAIPLEADIHQFWAWFSPGVFAAHLEFEARIQVTGPAEPFVRGEEYRGYVRLATQAATSRAWLNTVNKGLENLDNEMQTRLRAAPPPKPYSMR
jgi:hypothetical protein